MRSALLAVLLTGLMAAGGYSQPPVPSAGERKSPPPNKQTQPPQEQAKPVLGTEQSPAVVKVLPVPKTPQDTAQEQADRERQATTQRWTIGLTVASLVFTICLVVVGYLQWRTYRRQAAILDAQRETLDATLAANREIERAYVTMSHTPAKLRFEEPKTVWFEVMVRNNGRTPADLLGGVITVELGPNGSMPPEQIPTSRHAKIAPAFLAPNKWIRFSSMVYGLEDADIRRASEPPSIDGQPSLEMWLAGYVIYRDQFGAEHCGGYGRHWDRYHKDLVFDKTTGVLNYDRPPTDNQKRWSQP